MIFGGTAPKAPPRESVDTRADPGDGQATERPERMQLADTPQIAATSPFRVEVEEGKSYFWCACGKSSRQPFCDGSHKDTSFSPLKWTADATKAVFFCGCKQTAQAPMCDGSHKGL